jgi:Spy/CpxP family protein refolding chaperone
MHSAFTSHRCAPPAVPICHGYGAWRGHGPGARPWGGPAEEMDEYQGGGFGVRRPLRFLAHRLALNDDQLAEMARILDELKTERAQAEVDRRRSVAAFADALASDTFDAAKAGQGGEQRVKSAERLRDAVVKALQQIHAVLNAEQRVQLAYLIRTGTLLV